MASQGVAANSRLAQMQMRFQKKQLLEREQKKLALTGGDGVGDGSMAARNAAAAAGNGKVRQMFEQRRGVGIDRSHPLKPIPTQQPSNTMRRVAGGANPVATTTIKRTVNVTKQNISNMRNSQSNPNTFSSNGNLFGSDLDEMDNLESETFPKEFSSLSLDNTRIMGAYVNDGNNNNSRSSNGMHRDIMDTTITIAKKGVPSTNGIRLNPVITKKSPSTTTKRTAIQQSTTPSSANRTTTITRMSNNNTTNGSTKSPVKKTTTVGATGTKVKAMSKASNGKPATFMLAVKPPPRISTPPPGMAACPICQRNFNKDRLDKHEDVCRKMINKKRKIFDASKHRVKGTEAEVYVKKVKGTVATPKPTAAAAPTSVTASPAADANSTSKKNNWRKKHEEFINAIREAKKVQAYLAKGGKLSDLPPPPPSENPDYIQCPHCNRRFNASAAERHIPKCANMQHNKPKPPVQRKRF